jgi:hypothetical protein
MSPFERPANLEPSALPEVNGLFFRKKNYKMGREPGSRKKRVDKKFQGKCSLGLF